MTTGKAVSSAAGGKDNDLPHFDYFMSKLLDAIYHFYLTRKLKV